MRLLEMTAAWLSAVLLVLATASHATTYPGFDKLDEGHCVPLAETTVKALPLQWHKYSGYIKNCPLTATGNKDAKVSLVSVWAHDYFDAHPTESWDNVPPTLIVDPQLNQLGKLPEVYPMDWVTHLTIYYGEWKSGVPGEILVDVSNPAVSGDYYYLPLQWDSNSKSYWSRTAESVSGKRPYLKKSRKQF